MQTCMAICRYVFLDINMPLVTGWACLSALKAQPLLQHVPVVMYSTSSHASEISRARQLGALDYWVKPHSIRELKQKLATLLRLPG